jgi:PAP_fibrillin
MMLGKVELLETLANRSLLAKDAQSPEILAQIAALEARNPTAVPTQALDLLVGDWRLLYTTSSGILGLGKIPLVQLGQVYQSIRSTQRAEAGSEAGSEVGSEVSLQLYNIAEVSGLPWLEGIVSVAATFQVVDQRRVDVRFDRAVVGLQRLLGYQSPQQFIDQLTAGGRLTAIDWLLNPRDQNGWLDITYLDGDLRIGRGNQGSVFVLAKC